MTGDIGGPFGDEPCFACDAIPCTCTRVDPHRAREPVEREPLRFRYTNTRGETMDRRVIPEGVRFNARRGVWVVDAYDLDRGARRTFDFGKMLGIPTNEVK